MVGGAIRVGRESQSIPHTFFVGFACFVVHSISGSQIRDCRASSRPWLVAFSRQISTVLIVVVAPNA